MSSPQNGRYIPQFPVAGVNAPAPAAPAAVGAPQNAGMMQMMQGLLKSKLAKLPPDHPLADVAKSIVHGQPMPGDAEQRMMLALQQATEHANVGDKANVALEAASTLAGDVIKIKAQVEQLTSQVAAQRVEMVALVQSIPEKLLAAIGPVLDALPRQVQDAVEKFLKG